MQTRQELLPFHTSSSARGAGRVMTALLLANKATFSLHYHLLFPTVYQCALIHLFLISHLHQNVQQICSFAVMYLFVCVLPEASAFILLCDCCIIRWWGWSVERAKSWLARQKEISFAQQIHTAVRYKLSGREWECVCVCFDVFSSVCVRRDCVCLYICEYMCVSRECVCVLMKGSI